jgi:TIR domain
LLPSGGTGGVAVYDYGSGQGRLLKRVADGGTLWLVTSTRRTRQPRRYHLAYKLADCTAIEPSASLFSGRYDNVVRARDWEASRHFGFNDATSTVRRLRFTSGKTMAEVGNPGLRLLSIPELASGDIALLERLQHQIEQGRNVFISYSHRDASIASAIEAELGTRDVSVSRDVTMLAPGQRWEDALREEVAGTDCFVVLVSPDSGDPASYVRREVASGGLVTTILPILLPGGGWERFPELHRFQRWDYPARTMRPEAFDRLAAGIAATPRHAKRKPVPGR